MVMTNYSESSPGWVGAAGRVTAGVEHAYGRRDFLVRAGAAAAALVVARRLCAGASSVPAAGNRRFEVSASLYAWDLHDEGVEQVLDNLQQMAAVNSVYLIGVMHPEMRPLGGGVFPHNPQRKTWQAEDARCYWHPDLPRYGRVRPRVSDQPWLNRTDWLHTLVSAARQRGLRTGVELSHALIDRERMQGEFADLAQRNVHGTITTAGAIKWLQPPCPNHPETSEYLHALATDAVVNHGIDYVQSCIMSFDPAQPERGGGCFWSHCRSAALEFGFDLTRIQAALLHNSRDPSALADWNAFRFASVARVYQRLHAAVHGVKSSVDLRYNIHSRSFQSYGVSLPLLRLHLDSARLMDYTEQEGEAARMPGKRAWIGEIKKQLGADFPLLPALGVRLKATPALVREGVQIAVESGAAGVTLGHYDGATFPLLRAVREGLVTSGVLRP